MLTKSDHFIDDAIPLAAAELGMGGKFRYWQGGSGRRYLFTEVPLEELQDYSDAILVLTRPGKRTRFKPVWIGEVDKVNRRTKPWDRRQVRRAEGAYVHFLAGSRSDRKRVIDDLNDAA